MWSGPTILSAVVIIFQLKYHNAEHFAKMLDLSWMLVVSFGFFLVSLHLLIQKRYFGWSFISLVLQYAFAFYAYGFSHYPYLLYPYLTIYDSFTNKTMAIALVIAFIVGLFLLIPSLYLLMKLFLFNKKYVKGQM
jgi:cytochrome d ubiquinol oxidase subunit II